MISRLGITHRALTGSEVFRPVIRIISEKLGEMATRVDETGSYNLRRVLICLQLL